jgi:hypothetical protein
MFLSSTFAARSHVSGAVALAVKLGETRFVKFLFALQPDDKRLDIVIRMVLSDLPRPLEIGSNKASNVVPCGAARTLDSCRIAIYEAPRNWRSSRLNGGFDQI